MYMRKQQGENQRKETKTCQAKNSLKHKRTNHALADTFFRYETVGITGPSGNDKEVEFTVLPQPLPCIDPCTQRRKRNGHKHHHGDFSRMMDSQNMDQAERSKGGVETHRRNKCPHGNDVQPEELKKNSNAETCLPRTREQRPEKSRDKRSGNEIDTYTKAEERKKSKKKLLTKNMPRKERLNPTMSSPEQVYWGHNENPAKYPAWKKSSGMKYPLFPEPHDHKSAFFPAHNEDYLY